MGLFGDIAGIFTSGRAAKAISDAGIAAEHGVLGEKDKAQAGVGSAIDSANSNVGAAGTAAIDSVNSGVTNANSTLQGVLDQQKGNLDPYLAAGHQGVSSLSDYAASKPQFKFDQTDLSNDPGYQFQLKQGQEAALNAASRTGGVGGNVQKELLDFGQGLAGKYYNDAFSRSKATFDTNQSTTLANLKALTDVGAFGTSELDKGTTALGSQQADNTFKGGVVNSGTQTSLAEFLASLGLKGAEDSGNFGLKGTQLAGDYAVGAGQAHAAGITGTSAALSGAVTDVSGILAGIPGISKAIGPAATGVLRRF